MSQRKGFSLIEIILVISLMAFIFAVALPQLDLKTGTEVANKMGQIRSDFRAAFDLAVLSGKNYRFVFHLATGDYHLEVTESRRFALKTNELDRDPTEVEEKDNAELFEREFVEYEDLAGELVTDETGETEIPPSSPVVKAKSKLQGPKWFKVEDIEWGDRTIGPFLMIASMQAEHHNNLQTLADLGPEGRAYIYIFGSGYIEKAVLHIYFKKDELEVDEDQRPYTVFTNPYEGTATVVSDFKEIDVHADET